MTSFTLNDCFEADTAFVALKTSFLGSLLPLSVLHVLIKYVKYSFKSNLLKYSIDLNYWNNVKKRIFCKKKIMSQIRLFPKKSFAGCFKPAVLVKGDVFVYIRTYRTAIFEELIQHPGFFYLFSEYELFYINFSLKTYKVKFMFNNLFFVCYDNKPK